MAVRRGSVVLAAIMAGALAAAVAVPALAHEHKQVGNWNVTFGMTPEPVYTGQFYKTTWRFTGPGGAPVTGLAGLSVLILYEGKPYGPFTVAEAHGDPGLYEVSTIFARPGEYRFILSGSGSAGGEGGPFEVEFTKAVLDAAVITVGG